MIRMFLFAAGFLAITIGLLVFQPGSNRAPSPVLTEPVTRADPAILPAPAEPQALMPEPLVAPAPVIGRQVATDTLDDQSLRKMTWGALSNLNQATGRESAPGAPGSLLHTIVKRSLDENPGDFETAARSNPDTGAQLYIVQDGDSLVSIAEKVYGDVNMTGPLFVANQSLLQRPDDLRAGQTLVLPAP